MSSNKELKPDGNGPGADLDPNAAPQGPAPSNTDPTPSLDNTPSGDVDSKVPNSDTPPVAPAAPAFADPTLRGMTPQQVERYVKVLESKNKELEQEKKDFSRQGGPPAAPAAPAVDDDSFWENPRTSTQEIVRHEVTDALAKAIAPITEELNRGKALQAWEQARAQILDFAQIEGLVRSELMSNGLDPDTAPFSLIQLTARALKGALYEDPTLAAQHGVKLSGMGASSPATPPTDAQPAPPPQHPRSAPPVNTQGQPRDKQRELTEPEKYAARQLGMSNEEYLKYASGTVGEDIEQEVAS